ncbi:signal recognition particle-docking protein FtsY [Izhakiella capsodis]|uniref:Signal recognition particle receptor FtsY n=1 Tax=Izhakiella capsodis TaxID=1367852 RepID=A0A1I4YW17_9GAMM|nr:signal recognition particle-docking protein FtsY [Izhakiella capsodis]SFN42147.1 signal recognition particle-docking protein FtsY [Izhakiella capsodis]
MAKEKKRGFFSWLGLGRDEQKEAEQAAKEEKIASAQPAVPPPVAPDNAMPAVLTPEQKNSAEEWLPEDADRAGSEQEHKATSEAQRQMQNRRQDDDKSSDSVTVSESENDVSTQVSHEATSLEVVRPVILPPDALAPAVAPVQGEIPHDNSDDEKSIESSPDTVLAPDEIPTSSQQDALSEAELEAAALAVDPQDDDLSRKIPEEAEEAILPVTQERPAREGFFTRLKRGLVKTRQNLGSGFIGLFHGKKIDEDLFEELEEQLLIADVGVDTSRRIINSLTLQASRKQLRDAGALYGLLKNEMARILAKVDAPLEIGHEAPFVILMVGVNGVGKTTTIGKLARQYQSEGKSVMLAAGDTFRAAAVEQLQVWGQRNNIPVIAQHTGADSASVIFDAIQAAKARNVDVLIADTAGRLQNKAHLMEELKKITRVMKKLDENAPHEVMLTIDASTGQNAISQAKLFHEAVNLTGITLTKLDGTAKGGVIFSVADKFGIPIRYIGVGEGIEDLRPFNADDFIEALFAQED